MNNDDLKDIIEKIIVDRTGCKGIKVFYAATPTEDNPKDCWHYNCLNGMNYTEPAWGYATFNTLSEVVNATISNFKKNDFPNFTGKEANIYYTYPPYIDYIPQAGGDREWTTRMKFTLGWNSDA